MITEINDRLQIKQIDNCITFRIIDDERDKTMAQSIQTIRLLEIIDYDTLVNGISENSNRLVREEIELLKEIDNYTKYQTEASTNYYEMDIANDKRRIEKIRVKRSDLITLKNALEQLKEAISK